MRGFDAQWGVTPRGVGFLTGDLWKKNIAVVMEDCMLHLCSEWIIPINDCILVS